MKSALLIFAILTAAHPVAKVEPWRRVEASGYVRSEEELMLFGAGEKRLCLETIEPKYGHTIYQRLAFGSDADYRQAERCIGQAVTVDAYAIRRGCDQLLVPVSLREMR
jgi:hypothetical protein